MVSSTWVSGPSVFEKRVSARHGREPMMHLEGDTLKRKAVVTRKSSVHAMGASVGKAKKV